MIWDELNYIADIELKDKTSNVFNIGHFEIEKIIESRHPQYIFNATDKNGDCFNIRENYCIMFSLEEILFSTYVTNLFKAMAQQKAIAKNIKQTNKNKKLKL